MHSSEPEAVDQGLILERAIVNDRVHSGYLLTGGSPTASLAALAFVRALVCESISGGSALDGSSLHGAKRGRACEACGSCRRSRDEATSGGGAMPIALDGKGKRGPTYRHVGDHADLLYVARGADDTRITVGQIRDLQGALRLRGFEAGRRAAVIDGAEWLNANAQNALLRILEEPPPRTTLVLVAARPTAVLATIRSRCVRVRFADEAEQGIRDPETPPRTSELVALLDQLREHSIPQILDAAEAFRGGRAEAAEAVTELIDVSGAWLRERVTARVHRGERPSPRELDAHRSLQKLRRDLVQRNANPQMVAERLMFGLRDAVA
jgi:DNA polymerase III delta prime subunit